MDVEFRTSNYRYGMTRVEIPETCTKSKVDPRKRRVSEEMDLSRMSRESKVVSISDEVLR